MTNESNKRRGLGRGIDALFTPYEEEVQANEQVVELAIQDIRPNPHQPRKHFDPEALKELADSIRQSGVFQPIIVRQSMIAGYELIAGERRLRASKLAGKSTIPAIVRDLSEEEMIEIAVIENLQREDLTPLEEAQAYQTLMDTLKQTQAEVAERMGKSRSHVANYLRLLSLPDEIKEMLTQEELSMGQARTLLGVKNKDKMLQMAQEVVKDHLTVRQLEERVQTLNQASNPPVQPPKRPQKAKKSVQIQAIEEKMEEELGTSVLIKESGKKGTIAIDYFSDSDLMRILDILNIQL